MEKVYYSISEVAEIVGLAQSKLRFWEQEIPQLNPKKSAKGTRYYTEKDIELIKSINYLSKHQKLKIDGIKAKLSSDKSNIDKKAKIVEKLKNIKKEILAIRHQINGVHIDEEF